jgi:hypothetical protein
MTAGKRNVQQLKREKAQAKQARREARRAAPVDGQEVTPVVATEAELIEQLAAIHSALEAGGLSPQAFEEQRERIGEALEQIERTGQ